MKTKDLHGPGAALLILAAAGLAWYGQPSPDEKWGFLAPELEPRLAQRQVQIEPAELIGLMRDDYVDLQLIDVRNEHDWNLFHLWGAERIPLGHLFAHRQRFAELRENGVIVLTSNDEASATEAWKRLMATANRPNAYILAGGINRWLDVFSPDGDAGRKIGENVPDERLRNPPKWALGSRHPASLPDPHDIRQQDFVKKVKLQKRVVKKGGCG